MVEQSIVVQNKSGLHARPAALLVKEASRFKSKLTLSKNGKEIDLKSILGLMSLAVMAGETVVIRAEGVDEKEVIAHLVSLFENGLGETEEK
jgi:phosphotransferase system HPr (HPr) family protein